MASETASWWERALQFVNRDLWRPQETARQGYAWLRTLLQMVVLVTQEFARDQLLLRASALTYYSVLALVPLLAIVLSILSALGVSENLVGVVVDQIAAGAPEAKDRILGLVEKVQFGQLGTLGAAVLFLTTVLGISSIERTLNTIWGVSRERPWERRLPDYLAVLIVAPLLLGVAISVGTTLQSQAVVQRLLEIPGFETVYRTGLQQAPVVFLWLGFSFLYWFLPNTRVRVSAALVGGLFAAVVFSAAQQVYVGFQVGVGRYTTLFGVFASIPLLLIWIYTSWVIVLVGAEVSFAFQNLALVRRARSSEEPTPAAREAIGLAIATHFARAFRSGLASGPAEALADTLGLPPRSVRSILAQLEQTGILALRGEEDEYQLGRAAERIGVDEVLEALRGSREGVGRLAGTGGSVGRVLADLDRGAADALAGRTLADLIAEPGPESPEG